MLRTSGLKLLIFRSQLITETIEISFNCVTSVTKQEMKGIESQILRLPHLPNWFVDIFPDSR
jgi:hypothetical protein